MSYPLQSMANNQCDFVNETVNQTAAWKDSMDVVYQWYVAQIFSDEPLAFSNPCDLCHSCCFLMQGDTVYKNYQYNLQPYLCSLNQNISSIVAEFTPKEDINVCVFSFEEEEKFLIEYFKKNVDKIFKLFAYRFGLLAFADDSSHEHQKNTFDRAVYDLAKKFYNGGFPFNIQTYEGQELKKKAEKFFMIYLKKNKDNFYNKLFSLEGFIYYSMYVKGKPLEAIELSPYWCNENTMQKVLSDAVSTYKKIMKIDPSGKFFNLFKTVAMKQVKNTCTHYFNLTKGTTHA